jgi:hypothetical protein
MTKGHGGGPGCCFEGIDSSLISEGELQLDSVGTVGGTFPTRRVGLDPRLGLLMGLEEQGND